VRIDWTPAARKPLNFNFNFEYKTDPAKLGEANGWVRIDRFVEASAGMLKRIEGPPGQAPVYALERPGGGIESVQVDPADLSWFRFQSLIEGRDFYAMDLHATSIGRPPPASALAFPDLKKLARAVRVESFDLKSKPALANAIGSGRAYAPKLALAGTADLDATLKKVLPGVNVNALRAADAVFGARYRAALAEQGITFPTLKPATTQPTTTQPATTQRAAR
jgi:hypothetical protein